TKYTLALISLPPRDKPARLKMCPNWAERTFQDRFELPHIFIRKFLPRITHAELKASKTRWFLIRQRIKRGDLSTTGNHDVEAGEVSLLICCIHRSQPPRLIEQ